MMNDSAMLRRPSALPALVASLLLLPLTPWVVPAGEAAAQSNEDDDATVEATAHPLRPGDVIEVTSWSEPELSGEYVVDEQGRAVLPLLGPRQVAGVPPAQLREDILDEYRAQFRQDSFQVILKRRVRILGEVREPGLYHVDPSMTLGDALALAGGISLEGNPSRIRVMREGETVEEFELSPNAPISGDVRSGDQILVLRRSWLSRNSTIFVGAIVSGIAIYLTRR